MLEFLELEEWVGRRWHRWAVRGTSYPHYPDAAVKLADLKGELAVFFRISGGEAGIQLDSTAARGSRHRLSLRQRLGFDEEPLDQPRLDEQHLLLPPRIDLLPSSSLNRDLYFWLAAFFACTSPVAAPGDPLQRDIALLREYRRATEEVFKRYPGLGGRYRRLAKAVLEARPERRLPRMEAAVETVICALLGAPAPAGFPAAALYRAVTHPDEPLSGWRVPDKYRPPLPVPVWGQAIVQGTAESVTASAGEEQEHGQREKAGPQGRRKASRRRQEQSERDDPLVFNRFEKMLSISEMVNLNRMVDDEEDEQAEKSAEQLDELTVSPHRKKAAAKLRMTLDLAPGAVIAGALAGVYTYPEWDYRKRDYLPDQSRVLEDVRSGEGTQWQPDAATRRRIRRVRRQFEALHPRREVLRAQPEGPELDMDAVVRARCDEAATGTSSAGLYQVARPQARDLAADILVDVSLSTEAWLEDRRVIDVAKEALLVLASGLASCGDDFAIRCFTSHRRRKVWVDTLKRYDEALTDTVTRRIGALEPGRYTRMGPAIRHVTTRLAERPNRHRLLLLLCDGKPNDTDYYEGRYAIEDTRRAVLDARRQEIRVFGITIDREAGQYIPHLFGRGAYAIVAQPQHLSSALPRIYRQITGR